MEVIELVKGDYFNVVEVCNSMKDNIRIRFNNNEDIFVKVGDAWNEGEAKLTDRTHFIEKLDPFDVKMIAEFQHCVEFAFKTLKDWEESYAKE